ncbi:MarR family winged helix-turn-helix transcriptional regulator [Vitiosangium sp. GDMCC 1.1324]|uniref:MarR family winged helix-turn-helix transcriptional regulator n=1 Tax=Vitiosangium sp. (strain GDMCC 1.1324) TaxID=2138576 RepID=UPI001E311F49|nr:MarR family transcriptional regulator [Vitiosangium sp. GDMCC 1.1324]
MRRAIRRLMTRRLSGRTSRPFTQLLALKAIALQGVRTQAELAERLTMDAPAVSRLVDRLVEDGLVRRCAGENRRCVRLEVTEASRPDLEVLAEVAQWVDAEAGRHLSASEMEELKRLLEKLHAGLTQAQGADEAPPS